MRFTRGKRRPARARNRIEHDEEIDYKNLELLKRFISERGKIMPRKTSRISASQQRKLAREIKRARHLALLPFCSHHE